MVLVTEKAVRTAVVGVLAAGSAHPMTFQDIKSYAPGKLPNYYNEVGASDRFGGESRLGVYIGTGGYRITMRSVGRTEDAALDMRSKGRLALEYATLLVGDLYSTPVMFETADLIAEDDGWWSGLMTLTTTL